MNCISYHFLCYPPPRGLTKSNRCNICIQGNVKDIKDNVNSIISTINNVYIEYSTFSVFSLCTIINKVNDNNVIIQGQRYERESIIWENMGRGSSSNVRVKNRSIFQFKYKTTIATKMFTKVIISMIDLYFFMIT